MTDNQNQLLQQTRLFYFDQNRRVYEMNGIKQNRPFYEGYFKPITIVSETQKEYICNYGTVNKKSMKYHFGRTKYNVYTLEQKNDEVYIQENRHIIAEKVRTLSAEKLRKVEAIINCTSAL